MTTAALSQANTHTPESLHYLVTPPRLDRPSPINRLAASRLHACCGNMNQPASLPPSTGTACSTNRWPTAFYLIGCSAEVHAQRLSPVTRLHLSVVSAASPTVAFSLVGRDPPSLSSRMKRTTLSSVDDDDPLMRAFASPSSPPLSPSQLSAAGSASPSPSAASPLSSALTASQQPASSSSSSAYPAPYTPPTSTAGLPALQPHVQQQPRAAAG